MTTIESSPESATPAAPGTDDWAAPPNALDALTRWFTTTDHKLIGRLYISGAILGLIGTIVVNVLLGVERVDGTDAALDADTWSQLVDAQRVGLVFATMLPLALGVCVAVVPLQLGARSLAFPRLASTGMWMWLAGAILTVIALANNGGTLGGDADMVGLFIASIALMAIGITATSASLVTSIMTTRAPGMTMRRIPFFSWSALTMGIGLVLVMPVLVGTLVYLFVDHRNARTGFGGNEGFVTWAGWAFTQPTTFLFALPALGLFAELLPVTFRRRSRARGTYYLGLALVALAASFAGVTQQAQFNLPWSGEGLNLDDAGDKVSDLVPYLFFNVLPIVGASLIFVLALAAAIGVRRPNLTPAFLFAFGGYVMILVGMLGSALDAIDDVGLQGTVFEEATLVYVAYGAVLGAMGGIVHWAPKLFGRAFPTGRVAPLAVLGFLATVLAAFPLYVAGYLDQPAGLVYDDSDLEVWNILSLVGHGLMAITVLGFVGLMAMTLTKSADAVDDPWSAQTIEWSIPSPAPTDNYVDVPVLHSAEPMIDLRGSGNGGDRSGSDQERSNA